jgi:hypothetical protein
VAGGAGIAILLNALKSSDRDMRGLAAWVLEVETFPAGRPAGSEWKASAKEVQELLVTGLQDAPRSAIRRLERERKEMHVRRSLKGLEDFKSNALGTKFSGSRSIAFPAMCSCCGGERPTSKLHFSLFEYNSLLKQRLESSISLPLCAECEYLEVWNEIPRLSSNGGFTIFGVDASFVNEFNKLNKY